MFLHIIHRQARAFTRMRLRIEEEQAPYSISQTRATSKRGA